MISLRAYNKEIEQLIDNGQYDESIAHCQHILSYFPKCIETYRNLGKALLELKNYPEAMDIFIRVLTAFPDDFISHIGLSIIYEDQNKLDLSIWHMEQAFDIQPSNLAIQDELKRLFTLRDGEHPGKIRLTRGALVRMYARGELFQQAISEIKAILAQDPKRVDLEVLLAKMNYSYGDFTEAEDVCNHIIEGNPYCFEANQILQQIYLTKNNIDSASICRDRLIALDPYYRYTESPLIDQDISADKISLDKLVYSSDQNNNDRVLFSENLLSNQWDEKTIGEVDLLKTISNQNDISSDSNSISDADHDEEMKSESDAPSMNNHMPAWMQEAGWTIAKDAENSGLQDNIPHQIDQDKNHMLEFESLDAKKIVEVNDNSDQSDSEKEQEPNHYLENTPQSRVTSDDLSVLFSELREGKMDDDNLINDADDGEKIPNSDWKSQYSDSEMEEIKDSQSEEMPDWLKNIEDEAKIEKNESDDLPEWLLNLQSSVEPVDEKHDELRITSMGDDLQAESEISSVVEDQTIKMEFTTETETQESKVNDGWEKIDLANEETKEISSTIKENNEDQEATNDTAEESIPDWVKSVLSSAVSVTDSVTEDSPQGKKNNKKPSIESFLPENIDIEGNDLDQSDAGIISQQTNDELLDWLRGLKNNEVNVQSIEDSSTSIESIDLDSTDSLDANSLDLLHEKFEESILQQSESSLDNNASEKAVSKDLSEETQNDQIETEKNRPGLSEKESDKITPKSYEDVDSKDSFEVPESIIDSTDMNIEIESPGTQVELLEDLITKQAYDQIPEIIKNMESEGVEFDSIIQMIEKLATDQIEDFFLWQTLGDQYAHHGKLAEALNSYQKAEEVLKKSIST